MKLPSKMHKNLQWLKYVVLIAIADVTGNFFQSLFNPWIELHPEIVVFTHITVPSEHIKYGAGLLLVIGFLLVDRILCGFNPGNETKSC